MTGLQDFLPIMDIRQAGEYLQLSVSTMYRLVQGKHILAIRLRGKYRFIKTALDEYLHKKAMENYRTETETPYRSNVKGSGRIYTYK